MTKFSYKARDKGGALSTGNMEAENSRAVALQLAKLGYSPIAIVAAKNDLSLAQIDNLLASLQKVRLSDLIVFTRQLSSILHAGVPLMEGLDAVAEQVKNVNFQKVIIQVRKDIEGGSSFSDALEKHKKVFSLLVVNMVRAGEKAGILDEELDRISNLLEKDFETSEQIKTATRYPMIVVISLVIAFIFLTVKVIPSFTSFFGNFKTQLPLPTRILIGMNQITTRYWYWAIMVIVGGVYGLRRYIATAPGRKAWDNLMLTIPIFGPLFKKIYLARFTRMLSAMMRSGIPILDALSITGATIENTVLSGAILKIREDVSNGKSLTEPMRGCGLFPPIAISMTAIGEKAGTLEDMLTRLADYFEREADYTIKNLTPMLEPILIFGLGMIVLLFALGIFLPMWDMMKVFKTS